MPKTLTLSTIMSVLVHFSPYHVIFIMCCAFTMTGQAFEMKTSNLGHEITKITFSEQSDFIFVGGHNFISLLTLDLRVILKVDIGPVYETESCHPFPAPCDNNVTVLEFDSMNNGLLVCGTAYQGTCVSHNALELSTYTCIDAPDDQPTANMVVTSRGVGTVVQVLETEQESFIFDPDSVDGSFPFHCRSLDYGMVNFDSLPAFSSRPVRSDASNTLKMTKISEAGRTSIDEDGDSGVVRVGPSGVPQESMVTFVTRILVASWEKRSLSELNNGEGQQPIISLRSMRNSGFSFEMTFPNGQPAADTGIHVKPSLADSFEMNFKHAFTSGDFTYLLSLRTKPCDPTSVGNGICTITVLSRVNNKDPLIAPYMEMPLSCKIRSKAYDLLMSVAVGKISNFANGSYVEILVLIASFGKEKIPGSQIPDPAFDTAMCVFSVDMLNKDFDLAKDMCHDGVLGGGPPDWIHNTNAKCTNQRYQVPEILAGSGKLVSHKGHVLAIMPHTPQIRDGQTTRWNTKMHVYTADRHGQIHKFSLESSYAHNGYGITILTTPSLIFSLSPDISSRIPTSAGLTNHKRAVTYLAYGKEIVSLSLNFCRQFGTCSTCQENSQQCRWCPDTHSCLEVDDFQMRCKNEKPADSCPPHLTDFNPKTVPVSGGSILTIRGMHLGEADMGYISVKVCDQECDHVKPRMNTLECTLRAKCEDCPDKCFIDVEVKQRDSNGNASSRSIPQNNQLTYVIPKVTSISPSYGPLSGGIIVTVKGEHLRVGTRSYLEVLGTKCRHIYSTTENDLTCLMETAHSQRGQCGPMILYIDNHVTSSNATEYCFREDPKITKVEPAATLIDGGLILNVTGTNLNSVPHMQFEVSVTVVFENATKLETFTSQCDVIDATSMKCETPSMGLIRDELSNVEYEPGYMSSRMAFFVNKRGISDHRDGVKMFIRNQFLIYPTPKFDGIAEKSSESYIHPQLKDNLFLIKVQRIPEWLKPRDVKVFVEKTECPVKNITSDAIFCDVQEILRVYKAGLTTTTTTTPTTSSAVYNTTSPAYLRTRASKLPLPSTVKTTPRSSNVTVNTTVSTLLVTNVSNGSDITTAFSLKGIVSQGLKLSSTSSPFKEVKEEDFIDLKVGVSDESNNASFDESLIRRTRSDPKDDVTLSDTSRRESIPRYQLAIQIGNYRSIIGSVQVGPLPDELINPPVNGESKAELNYLLIGGIVGALVFFLLLLAILCAVYVTKKKRRVKKHPYYMNEIGSSHPGSSEVSMPTLTQILESELEPGKKNEINNLVISSDRLILGKVIGSGNFGCVYEGMLAPKARESPMKVAIKTLQDPVTHSINLREFVKEAIIMVGFQHPHVLGLVGLVEAEMGVPYVILPYMDNGDLLTYVRDTNRTLSLYDVVEFGIDICSGMAYLSSVKLVHRDLAARNCMLDNEYRAKVADFGLCRDIYEKGYYTSDNRKKLPIRWMAVESIERGAYSTKSDVWSMGVVLWELLSRGVTPYPGVDGWDVINYLRKRRLSPPYFCPDELYKLMMTCWAKDPEMRPTFKALQKELCLLIGQDPGSGSTTPIISRSVKTTGQTRTFRPGPGKSPSTSKNDSKKNLPKIQVTPETPREDFAQVEMELTRLEKSNQAAESDKEFGSVMSFPRSQAVENVMITIPACHSSRDITKSAAANYLQLVDNYEPAPKFNNPFHRSKKKHRKSDTRKSGSRKERDSSLRNMGGSEKRATPNDYAIPLDGQRMRTSADMRDSQHVCGPVDSLVVIHRPEGSNYFELERNSQRSSINSILDGRSSGGSSFMADPVKSVPGRIRDQSEHGTRCSSPGMSYQSAASSEDLTHPESETNNYDRLSSKYIETAERDRHYHSWKEPEIELRVNENGEGYDRLCKEFMDTDTSPVYPRWQESDITSRPDSSIPKYSRISDMEIEPDTSPYYQICEEHSGSNEFQEENVITTL